MGAPDTDICLHLDNKYYNDTYEYMQSATSYKYVIIKFYLTHVFWHYMSTSLTYLAMGNLSFDIHIPVDDHCRPKYVGEG